MLTLHLDTPVYFLACRLIYTCVADFIRGSPSKKKKITYEVEHICIFTSDMQRVCLVGMQTGM